MNGATVALPAMPFSALDGIPSADELATVAARRRYCQGVALALIGEPGWEVETWPQGECPGFLAMRASEEDWPTTGIAQHGMNLTIMLRPKPLPVAPDAMIAAAVEQVPPALRSLADEALHAFWRGEHPTANLAPLNPIFGEAILQAARRGHAAKDEVFEAALAAARQTARSLA